MRKLLIILSLLAVALSMASVAGADLIVDTGPNANYFYPLGMFAPGQWYAGEFTTTQAWNIGAMQGDIRTIYAGEVAITIYNNNGGLPGTALFTQTFQSEPDSFEGWQGTTGSAGTLPAGIYWIAFEVPAGSDFYGGFGGQDLRADPPIPLPTNPMSLEAYSLDSGATWTNAQLNLTARIEGSPVPVPGAFWLLGSGLVGLAGLRRFRKS
jgi:hypothetical protein